MIIALGNDHRGLAHKELIKRSFVGKIDFLDYGTHSAERTDYPLFAQPVCRAVQEERAHAGILFCGSGIGMAVMANRFKAIYAAVVWSPEVARAAKQDDNVNILVIPSDFINDAEVVACIQAWLSAQFKQGRYQERIAMIDALGGV